MISVISKPLEMLSSLTGGADDTDPSTKKTDEAAQSFFQKAQTTLVDLAKKAFTWIKGNWRLLAKIATASLFIGLTLTLLASLILFPFSLIGASLLTAITLFFMFPTGLAMFMLFDEASCIKIS